MNKLFVLHLALAYICTSSAKRLRGAQEAFISPTKIHDNSFDGVDKRKLVENIDNFLFNVDQYKVQYDEQNIGLLDVVNMIQPPVNKVELDVYSLPEAFDSDDYIGQLEGLLPTPTKYHNENFFLSMDVREHRYEEVSLDIFSYVHNINFQNDDASNTEPKFDNNDLFYRQDTRAIVGLMGLLPGYHHLDSLENKITETSSSYDSNGMLDILQKTVPVLNKMDSEAYQGLSSTRNHFVGMLHGLLPGGTAYHNDDFFLSFAQMEHHYDVVAHNFVDIIDKIVSGDKISSEAYRPLTIDGDDGKFVLGLLGLLPGSRKRIDTYMNGDVIYPSIKLEQMPVLDLLETIPSSDDLVNPGAYESPFAILNNGDYVGQLHGILPDYNNKMKYMKYGWDELIGSSFGDSSTFSVDLLNSVKVSATTGVSMDGPESGHDVTAALMTNPPTETPTSSPSDIPSASMSPSMSHERYIVAQVDFANLGAISNSNFNLYNGAQILSAPGVVSAALRIDKDGPYATIPGVDIGPSKMPECTLMIGLYVESIPNGFGWVFGHEESGYDRTILMHDNRFGGGIASAVGYPWNPWIKPHVPTEEWIHVTAVFRQGGESSVFLNGIKSDNTAIGKNDDGKGELWIGRARWGGHWTDSWIKEVKVFNTALEDSLIENYAEDFRKEVTHVPVICGSSYGNCQGNSHLSNINTSVHAVRCCSDFIRPGWKQNTACDVWAASEIDGLCYESETYASAHEICSLQGARLCTHSELKRDCAANSGCEHDHHMTWSSSSASDFF